MVSFRVVETFLGAPLHVVSGVTDMALRRTAQGLVLYAATRAGGGVMALEVDAGMALLGWQGLAAGQVLSAPSKLCILQLNGQDSLMVTGPNATRLGGFAIDAGGDLGAVVGVAGSPAAPITAQAAVTVGGATYVYMTPMNTGLLIGGRLEADGHMTRVASVPVGVARMGVQVADLLGVTVGGATYLVVLSQANDNLMTYRVGAQGQLQPAAVLGAAAGFGVNDPTSVTSVVVAGQTYLLVTAPGTSSISVVRLMADGDMAVTDHVIDTRDTRLQGVAALDTVVLAGRTFVVAAGGDGGVDLFELLPGGRLVLTAQLVGDAATPLQDTTALVVAASGAGIDIFVAGEGAGITRLRVELGDLVAPMAGTDAGEVLTGGGAGDCITGRVGNDTVYGGAGDDVIVDGSGADSLFGGAGADIFVLMPGGTTDVIRDFQLGVDRIDLSNWGRVFSLDALDIKERGGGVWLTFGNERVIIQAANGLTLRESMFGTEDFFGLWHLWAPPVAAGRFLAGTAMGEVQAGGAGNDVIAGSAGADTLRGGAGYDRVSYGAALTGLVIDMQLPGAGTGMAAGDTFLSIEAVSGSRGGDRILGSALADALSGLDGRDSIWGRLGDDLLLGDGGNDRLMGQVGRDRLSGGLGDDVLLGGAGGDVLDGGVGRDVVAYTAVGLRGVVADLRYTARNTGEALGDVYVSVEDVFGTVQRDMLAGNAVANRLFGFAAADMLVGREGNDSLYGGAGADTLAGSLGGDVLSGDLGNDVLVGGAGADRLIGGLGRDMAAYRAVGGRGVVADMMTPRLNTGEARGDTYASVEHLRGTVLRDTLGGNAGANLLNGMAGNDTLLGRAGADTLIGGAGVDRLSGGAGNDRLVGMAGADRFVFQAGRDTVVDFRAAQGDRLLIDRALVPRGTDVRELVAQYAHDQGRYITFNFGDGDVLVVQGVASLANLHQVIDII